MSLTNVNEENVFQRDVIGNVRKAQEDSHGIALNTPNGDLFVVCDGMGGHVGGKTASSIAVKSIIDYLSDNAFPNDEQRALVEAIGFANNQILGHAVTHPELKGMGTTACIVLINDNGVYIAHVGDSRIYLFLDEEKKLHRITKDHSFVQTLVDAGQITDEEAEHHPNKNRILKALGIKQSVSPTIGFVKPKNGDVFMICSDGLSGMVSDSEMEHVMMQKQPLSNKGDTLINMALNAGGVDNITLEMVRIDSSPFAKSEFVSYNPINSKGRIRSGAEDAHDSYTEETISSSSFVKWLIGGLVGLVVLIVGSCSAYFITDHVRIERELKNLDEQIKTLNIEIANTGINLKKKKEELGKQERLMKTIDANDNTGFRSYIAQLKSEIDSLEKKLEAEDKQLSSLKKKKETYKK